MHLVRTQVSTPGGQAKPPCVSTERAHVVSYHAPREAPIYLTAPESPPAALLSPRPWTAAPCSACGTPLRAAAALSGAASRPHRLERLELVRTHLRNTGGTPWCAIRQKPALLSSSSSLVCTASTTAHQNCSRARAAGLRRAAPPSWQPPAAAPGPRLSPPARPPARQRAAPGPAQAAGTSGIGRGFQDGPSCPLESVLGVASQDCTGTRSKLLCQAQEHLSKSTTLLP
jgi:hypothetical protein